MSYVSVKFKPLGNDWETDDKWKLPIQAHEGDAGFDLCAYLKHHSISIMPGAKELIPCGFAMSMPIGYEAQIRPRSGLAKKHGVTVLNSPGTIDSSYRGEVGVILINNGNALYKVCHGDRIAQMVISIVPQVVVHVVDELDDTDRGTGGFGSTGLKNS